MRPTVQQKSLHIFTEIPLDILSSSVFSSGQFKFPIHVLFQWVAHLFNARSLALAILRIIWVLNTYVWYFRCSTPVQCIAGKLQSDIQVCLTELLIVWTRSFWPWQCSIAILIQNNVDFMRTLPCLWFHSNKVKSLKFGNVNKWFVWGLLKGHVVTGWI